MMTKHNAAAVLFVLVSGLQAISPAFCRAEQKTPSISGAASITKAVRGDECKPASAKSSPGQPASAPTLKSSNQAGTYQPGTIAAGNLGVRYFVAEFVGDFTYANADTVAKAMMSRVKQQGMTHVTTQLSFGDLGYGKHIVIGYVTTAGGYHWTAARLNGTKASVWFDVNRFQGSSDGWVVRDVTTSNGTVLRYQFGDNDRRDFVWVIKHFSRN